MYELSIRTPQNEMGTALRFETFEAAEGVVTEALEKGHFSHKNLVMFVGEGTLFVIMSDEEKRAAARSLEEAKRSGGLTGGKQDVKPEDFVLVVQVRMIPLHLVYASEEECDTVLADILRTGRIEHIFKHLHDHVYMRVGSGMLIVKLPGHVVIAQRREAVAMQQRQLATQAPQQKSSIVDPKSLLPFGQQRK
jgi:hypothetical protein